ncbi:MAG TPA: hypothetical protein DGG94_06410 [Micromonosporaceae bacterium]|nr:hypothetical protein [Micromonosporaceae bacterium]HCU49424.1 hypothetical protein [Micromonosporaceae bacterium]
MLDFMGWVLHAAGLLLIVYVAIRSHLYTRRMEKQIAKLHAEFISLQDPQAAPAYRQKLVNLGFEAQAWNLSEAPAEARKAIQSDPMRTVRFGWAIAGIGLAMVFVSSCTPS